MSMTYIGMSMYLIATELFRNATGLFFPFPFAVAVTAVAASSSVHHSRNLLVALSLSLGAALSSSSSSAQCTCKLCLDTLVKPTRCLLADMYKAENIHVLQRSRGSPFCGVCR